MKTKICVPLFVTDIVAAIHTAQNALTQRADVIEFRLDDVDVKTFSLELFISALKKNGLFSKSIFTVRRKDEYGKWSYSEKERQAFLFRIAEYQPVYLDIEIATGKQFIQTVQKISPRTTIIVSAHKKKTTAAQLSSLYNKMKSFHCGVIKIAVETETIEETAPLFSLLQRAKGEGQNLIAIGMGSNGEITRILAPAFGAFLTFASLNNTFQTAGGQVSLAAMNNVYNIHSINSRIKIFGLIGNPVSRSKGIYVHNAAFKATKTNAVYVNCETQNVQRFLTLFQPYFEGFSITAPHKETAKKLVSRVGTSVYGLDAINTMIKRNGALRGENTDGTGFRASFPKSRSIEGTSIAILGSGGAAQAIIATLVKEKPSITIFNRTLSHAKKLAAKYSCKYDSLENFANNRFDALINTIPFSVSQRFPEQYPLAGKDWNKTIVCDIVYNPIETPLLIIAKINGATIIPGWKMFLNQAAQQFELFTGKKAPVALMKNVLLKQLANKTPAK